MGILANVLSISGGVLIGSRMKRSVSSATFDILGIGIMILSLVGFIEGIFNVSTNTLESTGLVTVVLSLIIGSWIGDRLQLGNRITRLCALTSHDSHAVIEATLYFGIGGMQISGPILLALGQDNTQLFLKSIVDLPFALLFGATYGKKAAFASIPVALMQLGVFALALLGAPLMDDFIISQICVMGYIILFFTGYNVLSFTAKKIENVNMLPAILVNILFHLTTKVIGVLL